ncbi:MAG: type II toxin-antitoxin system RelE/ParE family toxin [Burkholderiales bacterium]|jgi:mRNA interferase RelE/StbE|nr:type II toxin-antitoxin system RelE/ParE family toxin [Burkholderiales bacterium]
MTYELNFTPSAKKEWDKLDNSVKQMFKKALAKRLINPIVPVSKLRDLPIDCYKIKLRTIGYRLVYTIENNKLILLVLTINRRDVVYDKLNEILK